jgi:hypothetical protein
MYHWVPPFVIWNAAMYSVFSNNQKMRCYRPMQYTLMNVIWFELLRSQRMGRHTHYGVGNTFLQKFLARKLYNLQLGIPWFSNYLFIIQLNNLRSFKMVSMPGFLKKKTYWISTICISVHNLCVSPYKHTRSELVHFQHQRALLEQSSV